MDKRRGPCISINIDLLRIATRERTANELVDVSGQGQNEADPITTQQCFLLPNSYHVPTAADHNLNETSAKSDILTKTNSPASNITGLFTFSSWFNNFPAGKLEEIHREGVGKSLLP
jgi:hypothetical protein